MPLMTAFTQHATETGEQELFIYLVQEISDVARTSCLLGLIARLDSPFLIPRIFNPRFNSICNLRIVYGVCQALEIAHG